MAGGLDTTNLDSMPKISLVLRRPEMTGDPAQQVGTTKMATFRIVWLLSFLAEVNEAASKICHSISSARSTWDSALLRVFDRRCRIKAFYATRVHIQISADIPTILTYLCIVFHGASGAPVDRD